MFDQTDAVGVNVSLLSCGNVGDQRTKVAVLGHGMVVLCVGMRANHLSVKGAIEEQQ